VWKPACGESVAAELHRTGWTDSVRPPTMAGMIAGVHVSADRGGRLDSHGLKSAVDRRLAALLPESSVANELAAALRYSVLAPGKRIRPLLTIMAGWESGPRSLIALDAGCALEMVHAASLILDDMPAMDDAPERRGQAATHVRFGEDVAMLSAITLLNQAYGIVAAMDEVDAETRCALIAILSRAIGLQGLAGGQYADLRPSDRREAAAVALTTHLKTGVLFVAAVEMAAAVHRMSIEATERLRGFAIELGQAFQILDDLIDSRTFLAGRAEDDGKATLLSLLGQEAAHGKLRTHVDGALGRLQPTGALAIFVRGIFSATALLPEVV
jgi:geranylgeranyl diphosphate synthase, type II